MSTRTLRIPTARVFTPLLGPLPYKGAHGGRASGKSHFFAGLMVEDCVREPGETGEGLRCICIREVLKDLKESAKLLIEDKLQIYGLGEADGFKVFRDVIQTPKDGVIIFKGMQDYTAESVKSLENFKRAWIEEAQTLRERSLALLRPTIRRSPGSQIWASWNPRRKIDAIDNFFRTLKPPGAVAVKVNWKDNPWFSAESEEERQLDLKLYPDRYDHTWEGGYASVTEGAYYAKSLAEANKAGHIGNVSADPLMTLRAFVDIGGTGSHADAFVFWIAQFIGKEIRVLDYYEAVGQEAAAHVNWLRGKGYTPDKCQIWLPHDGPKQDSVYDTSHAKFFRAAEYKVTTVPNQGSGAALKRVEAARRLFPSIWFNQATTQPGLDALGWYHEKRDDQRNIGLGPEHDWASHGADAFGLMCVAYEEPRTTDKGWKHVARKVA